LNVSLFSQSTKIVTHTGAGVDKIQTRHTFNIRLFNFSFTNNSKSEMCCCRLVAIKIRRTTYAGN